MKSKEKNKRVSYYPTYSEPTYSCSFCLAEHDEVVVGELASICRKYIDDVTRISNNIIENKKRKLVKDLKKKAMLYV
jgi:hypothetical protein